MTTEYVEGHMYLTVRRDWRNGTRLLPTKVTGKAPNVVDADEVVVRVFVRVPVTAFVPLQGGIVTVEEPEGLAEVTP